MLSGASSFLDLSLDLFVTQFVPWLSWIKIILVKLLGDFGYWVLTIPVLIIAPVKFVLGTVIGLWAYFTAKRMPVESPQI